jgi:hypothetical protein
VTLLKLPLVDHVNKRIVFAGPGAGYRMLDEYGSCALCNEQVRLCKVGMLMWFHKRCSQCLLKIH